MCQLEIVKSLIVFKTFGKIEISLNKELHFYMDITLKILLIQMEFE